MVPPGNDLVQGGGRVGDLVTKHKKDLNEVLAPSKAQLKTQMEVTLKVGWKGTGIRFYFWTGPAAILLQRLACQEQGCQETPSKPGLRVVAQAGALFLGWVPCALTGMKARRWGSPWS